MAAEKAAAVAKAGEAKALAEKEELKKELDAAKAALN